jgi:glycine/D-amino acid oxidase-like deaminating enzyme
MEGQIRDLVGASDYIGGWMDERGGTVQPLAYTQGLALAAKKAGAIIHGDSPAIAMRRVGAAWRVSTPAGEVTAPKLLLAINAMGGDLLPALNRMVMPVWSYQIATAPLSSAERAGVLPTQVAASDTRRVLRYFRLDREHRLVVGGKGKSHAPRSPADFDFQRATLHRLYPALAGVPIDFRWGGQVAVTPDRLPRAVSLGPQAFANLGCNGKGIAWCTAMGQAFAESFATGSTGCLPIPVTPVRPIPLHQLRRLYVGAGSAWLRFRDRLDHSSNVTNSSQGAST